MTQEGDFFWWFLPQEEEKNRLLDWEERVSERRRRSLEKFIIILEGRFFVGIGCSEEEVLLEVAVGMWWEV